MPKFLLRLLARGLLARLAGYGMLGLGFWLIFRGFAQSGFGAGIGMGLGGAGLILAGMYVLVSVGRNDSSATASQNGGEAISTQQEVSSVDRFDGSNQGG